MEISVLYTDLESVLDVRAGALRFLRGSDENPRLEAYLASKEYNLRTYDDFGEWGDNDIYRTLLNNGSSDILFYSRPSYLLGSIYSDIVNIETRASAMTKTEHVEVWLNIYPFKLTQSEIDLLQSTMFTKLRGKNMVNIINIPPENLTPAVISTNNIKSIYMYLIGEWLEANGSRIMETNIKETRMHFSPIARAKPTAEQEEIIKESAVGDAFTFFDTITSTYITSNHLLIPIYSEVKYATPFIKEYSDILAEEITIRSNDIDIDEEELDGYLGGHLQGFR